MKKIFMLCAMIALLLPLVSCKKGSSKGDNSLSALKERGVFVLGLDDSFPPLGFRDENNNIVGYDIDLAKEVASRLGVQFKAQPIDWDSKEQELSTGKIDCIWNGFTVTEERRKSLSVTKPYLKNAQILVVKSSSNIKKLDDMAGKKIALQNGSSAEDAVNDTPKFKDSLTEIVPYENNLLCLNDLLIGGVDGVVMDSVVAEYAIRTGGYPFTILKEGLAPEEYVIAFRKGDVKLTNEVQAILEQMARDGTIAQISKKWFADDISIVGK